MKFDATFWVAISFIIFFGGLIYLKIPKKINDLLSNMIKNIKNEIDESERLRTESKVLLDKAQNRLDNIKIETKKISEQAKKDSEKLIIDMNEKFYKSVEIKKNLTQLKIAQMKEAAIKEIKDDSIKLAVNSVKKIITTSVDQSKLDALFEKNLEETKIALKNINS